MNAADSKDEKAALRLLRFLTRGAGRCRPAACKSRMLIEIEAGATIGVDIVALKILGRRGLVERAGDKIAMTALGRAVLKRMSAVAGDGCREQHGDFGTALIETDEGRQLVTVNHGESPLALLFRRKTKAGMSFLSEREFRAGERLRADYSRGRIMARMGVTGRLPVHPVARVAIATVWPISRRPRLPRARGSRRRSWR